MRQNKRKLKSDNGPQPRKAVSRGTVPNQTDSPLTFNFLHKDWLKSVNHRDFTNKLSDETMFTQYLFELFHKVIPIIQQNWPEIIRSQGRGSWQHCHPISDEKLDFVLAVIEKMHGHSFRGEKNAGPSLWQFGVTQNIRLIAIYDYTNNYLTPVFVDYHHLIYPSKYFNQPDFKRYDYCPVCELSR